MLRKISSNKFEMSIEGEVFQITFSMGTKDLLFRTISDCYSKISVNNSPQLISEESRKKYLDLVTERTQLTDLEEINQISEEIAEMYKAIVEEAERTTIEKQEEMKSLLISSITEFKYDVWALLLTQRDVDGKVVRLVTKKELQTEPKYSDVETELEELLTIVIAIVDDRVKKTLGTVRSLQEVTERAANLSPSQT